MHLGQGCYISIVRLNTTFYSLALPTLCSASHLLGFQGNVSSENKALRSFEWFPGAKLKCAGQRSYNCCVPVVGIQMSSLVDLTITTTAS